MSHFTRLNNDIETIIKKTTDVAHKRALERALVALNVIDNEVSGGVDGMLMSPIKQHRAEDEPIILSKLHAELERHGWEYCPDSTPPNDCGYRGWMHPRYAQRGIYHILYINTEWHQLTPPTFDVSMKTETHMHWIEMETIEEIHDWMDATIGLEG